MRTRNMSVKQFNLNVKITLFKQSMFYRFQRQDICDEMSISHQEKTGSRNVLLRGPPIIHLKLLAAEGHIYWIKA